MRSQEELKEALRERPDSFDILYEYVRLLCKANDLKHAFMLAERGIAVYDASPIESMQEDYLDLKRTRNQLLRDHLDEILDELCPLMDPRWMPTFKLGRPREIAWQLGIENLDVLSCVLRSDQLRRLRFLGVTITDHPDLVLGVLSKFNFDPVRVLNLSFLEDPSAPALQLFWEKAMFEAQNITNLSVRMPHLTDRHAIVTREHAKNLESLSLLSLDRTCMTSEVCDCIADDENSNKLMNLAIVGSSIGDKGFWTLLTSDNFTNLQTLDLHDGFLTNATARLLAAEIHLPQLRSLDLRYNTIDPAGIDILEDVGLEMRYSDQHARPAGRI